MQYYDKIMMGSGIAGPAFLLSSMATKHGIISGATGTGKTVCMKILAEGFSSLSVPVFLTDIKGDLGNVLVPGKKTEANNNRLIKCGIDPDAFPYQAFPALYWDLFGKTGIPIRTTVSNMDPLLMARLLGLNEVQTDTLEMVYRLSRDLNLEMDDLRDLHAMLLYTADKAKEISSRYGFFYPATISVIQRQVYALEDQGIGVFFGKPAVNILDWFTLEPNGFGFINVLNSERLYEYPYLYTTFLLWVLTELIRILPDRGTADKPIFALLFDEAHLLFKNCSARLLSKIEQMIRFMRSKGVAIFLQTWNPAEIPAPITRQLHNRILLAMNAYTPMEQNSIRSISDTFPISPYFRVGTEINSLGIGEAIVNFLKEDGSPGITDRITILPPQSQIGVLSAVTKKMISGMSPFHVKY